LPLFGLFASGAGPATGSDNNGSDGHFNPLATRASCLGDALAHDNQAQSSIVSPKI
jgi:hypothetical protein